MNDDVKFWVSVVVTLITTCLVPIIGWLLRSHLTLKDDVHTIKTILMLTSEDAAKILHSPHTPEMDGLLEKYGALNDRQTARLLELCQLTIQDTSRSKGERLVASTLKAVASQRGQL